MTSGIDAHCHLEYMDDPVPVIERCKTAGMKALITSAVRPEHFEKALLLTKKYRDFVFMTADAVHPEFVKEFDKKSIDNAFDWLYLHQRELVGIGEQGLDFFWVKDQALRERQIELFERSIDFAKELDKVIVVHSRDAHEKVIEMLEKHRAEKVHLHMWGDHNFVKNIIDNGWLVSVGPVVANSKKHRKVVRGLPVERLMLETDSPWFGPRNEEGKLLGEPTNIRIPAEEIAKIKEMETEEVYGVSDRNTVKMFKLDI